MLTCQIHTIDPWLKWVKCQHLALESDPEGLCILHSRQPNKDKEGAFTDELKGKLHESDYDFAGVFFPGPVSFIGYSFKERANFFKTIFHDEADFTDATFPHGADFSLATFSKKTKFRRVVFSGVDFKEATFLDKAYFEHAKFEFVAHFSGTKFSGKTEFLLSQFNGAYFNDAIFSGNTRFHAYFQGLSNFIKATFSGECDFQGTEFSYIAEFNQSIFSGRISFNGTTFSESSSFHHSIFSGETYFIGVIFSKKGDMSRCRIEPHARLRFQDLSLARIEFTGTDLRRVEFDRVTWAFWWWRAAVYDEIRLHQRRWAHITYVLNYGWFWGKRIPGEEEKPRKPSYKDFAPVERLYRQLKINYEDERDFKQVGDFHYGEIEMHRRGSPWRQWIPVSWHNLYCVLNGYGERPPRALGWLAVFLLALPLLVWGLGLDSVTGGTTPGFLETLAYIFEKATFQRPPLLSNLNHLGSFISNLSLLIIPGQAALFLLALRNRLGRRR